MKDLSKPPYALPKDGLLNSILGSYHHAFTKGYMMGTIGLREAVIDESGMFCGFQIVGPYKINLSIWLSSLPEEIKPAMVLIAKEVTDEHKKKLLYDENKYKEELICSLLDRIKEKLFVEDPINGQVKIKREFKFKR